MSDLIVMCVQEEERVKADRKDVVNQVDLLPGREQ